MVLLESGAMSTQSPAGAAAAVAWLGTVLPDTGWDEARARRQVSRDPRRNGAAAVEQMGTRYWLALAARDAIAAAESATRDGNYPTAQRLVERIDSDYADTVALDAPSARARVSLIRMASRRAEKIDWRERFLLMCEGPGRVDAAVSETNLVQMRWWPPRETGTPWSPGPWRRTGSASLASGELRIGAVAESGGWLFVPLLRGPVTIDATIEPVVAGSFAIEWVPQEGDAIGFAADAREPSGVPRSGLYSGAIDGTHNWLSSVLSPFAGSGPFRVTLAIAEDGVTVSVDGRVLLVGPGIAPGAARVRIRTAGPSEWRVSSIAITGRLDVAQIP
jgi:hypothetical protein